jgi:hypothetical protein
LISSDVSGFNVSDPIEKPLRRVQIPKNALVFGPEKGPV